MLSFYVVPVVVLFFFPLHYNKSLSASVVYAAMLFCWEAPEMFCELHDFPPGEEIMIKMFMFGWMFPLNILLVIGKKKKKKTTTHKQKKELYQSRGKCYDPQT